MSLLIAGGCGFLGLNLAEYSAGLGEKTVLYDLKGRIPSYFAEKLKSENMVVVKGDILDYGKLLETLVSHQVEDIVHTAAIWGENFCREQPLHSLQTNILGATHLLELARSMGIRRTILISSRSAYGEYQPEQGPTDENVLPRPAGFYGAAKAAADLICRSYRRQFGLDAVALRPTGIYGPGWTFQTPIMRFVQKALCREKIVMPEGGEYRYEFNYVGDVVEAVARVRKAPSIRHSVYNVGSGIQYTLIEIAETVKRHISEMEFEIGPGLPEGATPRTAMDVSRFENEFGYRSQYSLDQGVAEYVNWAKGDGKEFFQADSGEDFLVYSKTPGKPQG